MRPHVSLFVLAAATLPSALQSQQASFVYRLGKDTVAIEQYTRTSTGMHGEMVQRTGAAVVRVQYDLTLGKDGRPVSAMLRRLLADGSVTPNAPTETRFRMTADSAIREVVWPDSVQRRVYPVRRALVSFPTFVYGPTEILAGMRRAKGVVDSIPALGATGDPGFTGFSTMSGDSVRLRGGFYAMILRFDSNSRLLAVDGSGTTNKSMATRGDGMLDMAAIAATMKPTGTLSVRDVARGAFGPGGIVLIDYGRPQVRERTVWGGALVPFDSVWRAGANDATHLFTTRTLTFGTLIVAPGMYTLWVQHTRDGTFLIVNKQTGQWGTQYDAAYDLGRTTMQLTATPTHVEALTMTVKSLGNNRGAIDLAWGPTVATAAFTVSAARP